MQGELQFAGDCGGGAGGGSGGGLFWLGASCLAQFPGKPTMKTNYWKESLSGCELGSTPMREV